MACEGFSGVMSCACKRLCAIELGNHSVKAKPCFELRYGTASLRLSNQRVSRETARPAEERGRAALARGVHAGQV